jgi:hypothetical protein
MWPYNRCKLQSKGLTNVEKQNKTKLTVIILRIADDIYTYLFVNYINTNTHAAAQINPNKGTPHNDVWKIGRQLLSKLA